MTISDRFRKFKTSNEYFNATFIYIIANGIGQGTTLLANIFFTRYMSRGEYGLYSNYYSCVALLGPFIGLNLYYGLMNAYIDYKDDIKNFRSSVLLLSLLGLTGTTFILLIVNGTLNQIVSNIVILLCVIHAYGFFLVNFFIQSANMENKYMSKGMMLAVPSILQAVFAGIAVIICNTYIGRAVGATSGIIICGIISMVVIFRECRPTVNGEYWKYALRISAPAIIGSLSAMIMMQCDNVMITSIDGPDTTAVYSLAYNVGYILYAVVQATSGAWQAWLFRTLESKKYGNIKDVQKWYLFFMLTLATGLYMVAPEIIKLLSPPDYWHFEYVPPFLIGSFLVVMYTVNGGVIQFSKRTDVGSGITAIAALVNIVLNYLLIPRYGGVGAAYTSVVSYGLIFVLGRAYLRKKKQYYFSDSSFATGIAAVTISGVIFYCLKDMIFLRYTVFIVLLTAEAVYLLKNHEDIKRMFGGRIIS